MTEKNYRSFLKGISWRIVGTVDTVFISYFFTQNSSSSLKIGLTEIITKIILYYFHERVYLKLAKEAVSKRKTSLIKGFSWRIVGSIDTILLAWIYTGNPVLGLKIGLTEFLTKVFLFYMHERIWEKISFGKNKLEV